MFCFVFGPVTELHPVFMSAIGDSAPSQINANIATVQMT